MAYHHGNLREALIETALGLIGERGPAGFAFAEVARAAGVSPAAPYRHFRDRNALVAEVARLGFERFADALETAWNGGRPDPVRAIETCGRAYLAFARTEPAFFAAMFAASLPDDASAGLSAASDRAFGVIRRAADAACATHKPEGRPPRAHGRAPYLGDGARRRLPVRLRRHRAAGSPIPPEDLLEAALLIYLQSIGRPAGKDHEPATGLTPGRRDSDYVNVLNIHAHRSSPCTSLPRSTR